MPETLPATLKQLITAEYIIDPGKEWLEVHISTSGLLNLTVVSDRFFNLSIPQRKEQVLNLLHQSQISLSPGFLSLYTPQEAKSLDISPPPAIYEVPIYT